MTERQIEDILGGNKDILGGNKDILGGNKDILGGQKKLESLDFAGFEALLKIPID